MASYLGAAGFVAASAAASAAISARRQRRARAPRPRRETHHVLIGAIPGENRGPKPMDPPVAVVDPYYWLRDDTRSKPEVLAHLKAENEYTQFVTAGLQPAVDSLYQELVSRLKETDADVPYSWGGWRYYTRTEKGKSYKLHCRVPVAASASAGKDAHAGVEAAEIVYLDENVLASGMDFCDVSDVCPSPDHTLMAYCTDTSGYETYTIRFKLAGEATKSAKSFEDEDGDAHTHPAVTVNTTAVAAVTNGITTTSSSAVPVTDILRGTNGEVEWGGDNGSCYYLTMDDAHRPHKLWRHTIGQPQSSDTCLFTEVDERFWVGMGKSSSGDFLVLDSSSKTTSEVRLVPLTSRGVAALRGPVAAGTAEEHAHTQPAHHDSDVDGPSGDSIHIGRPYLVSEREEGVLYEVEHYRHVDDAAVSGAVANGVAGHVGSDAADGDLLLVLTNRGGARNFKLCACRPHHREPSTWVDILPSSNGTNGIYITGFDVFAHYLAVYGRRNGYTQIWMSRVSDACEAYHRFEGKRWSDAVTHSTAASASAPHAEVPDGDASCPSSTGEGPSPRFPLVSLPPWESVYSMHGSSIANRDYDTRAFRFKYASPTTPERTCEYDLSSILASLSGDAAAARHDDGQTFDSISPAMGAAAVDHHLPSASSPSCPIVTGTASAITILKQKEVPNCNPKCYATKRIWAVAADGKTRIPISIVYRPSAHGLPDPALSSEAAPSTVAADSRAGGKSAASEGAPASGSATISDDDACPFPTGPAPILLYGYGSYGHSIDLGFSASILSLCDRGVAYAVAHVRGGCEMGRDWYEREGKLLQKKNTFSDFISCAEHLISTGWTAKGGIAAQGASAGGLLMGCVLNARPDLWGGIVSDVGFVDVIQSVADPSIPLAVTEWEEWGNPNELKYFNYMSSYSPIDNVRPPSFHAIRRDPTASTRPSAAFLEGMHLSRAHVAAAAAATASAAPADQAGSSSIAPRHQHLHRRLPAVLRNGYPYPYPPTLLTAGLNDSRVAYWEAAKYAARLRDSAAISVGGPSRSTSPTTLMDRVLSAVGLASGTSGDRAGGAGPTSASGSSSSASIFEEEQQDGDVHVSIGGSKGSKSASAGCTGTSTMFSGNGSVRSGGLFCPGGNILLKTDMGAGHFSYADRYVYLREKALELAFVLDTLGVPVA